MSVDMQPVSSSNVSSVGYDEETQALYVEFNNGSTYRYNGVPFGEYQALINAPSIGSHLARNIKPIYSVEKL